MPGLFGGGTWLTLANSILKRLEKGRKYEQWKELTAFWSFTDCGTGS